MSRSSMVEVRACGYAPRTVPVAWICPAQDCLDLINRHGPLSPSNLARQAGLHPATITGILGRRENAGWIARERDPADRRAITRPGAAGPRQGVVPRPALVVAAKSRTRRNRLAMETYWHDH